MYEVQLAFGYWLAGVIPHAPGTIERVIGTLRYSQSVESAFTFVWYRQLPSSFDQGALAFALWAVAPLPTACATFRVPAWRGIEQDFLLSTRDLAGQREAQQYHFGADHSTGRRCRRKELGRSTSSLLVITRQQAQEASPKYAGKISAATVGDADPGGESWWIGWRLAWLFTVLQLFSPFSVSTDHRALDIVPLVLIGISVLAVAGHRICQKVGGTL